MRQDAVDGRRNRRHHLKFDEQRKVIRENVRVGTPDNFVLLQPFGRVGTQETERSHRLLGVEDVVYDTLEVVPAESKRRLGTKPAGEQLTCNWCKA